jgi:hypothetical protein
VASKQVSIFAPRAGLELALLVNYYPERKMLNTMGCHWQLAASAKYGLRTGGQAARGTRPADEVFNNSRSP